MLFDCLLNVFDEWYTVPIVKNTQNHWCTNRHRFTKTVPIVYQRCTNRQKQSKTIKRVKTSKMTIGAPVVAGLPELYQQCTNRQKQSKQHKNDHWCTSCYMSTKTVPTVYQQCTKNSQTVKTAYSQPKMTIGVPIVTGLPRLYQQCNKNLPIVNKNLAIANRASAAHTIRHSWA